jgi:hypothetical protein
MRMAQAVIASEAKQSRSVFVLHQRNYGDTYLFPQFAEHALHVSPKSWNEGRS